jgi:hypothetical protein
MTVTEEGSLTRALTNNVMKIRIPLFNSLPITLRYIVLVLTTLINELTDKYTAYTQR